MFLLSQTPPQLYPIPPWPKVKLHTQNHRIQITEKDLLSHQVFQSITGTFTLRFWSVYDANIKISITVAYGVVFYLSVELEGGGDGTDKFYHTVEDAPGMEVVGW